VADGDSPPNKRDHGDGYLDASENFRVRRCWRFLTAVFLCHCIAGEQENGLSIITIMNEELL